MVSVCFSMICTIQNRILLIFFALVIFIGGVAFSISHAIIPTEEAEHIKHLAEVNLMENNCFSFRFSCLYRFILLISIGYRFVGLYFV